MTDYYGLLLLVLGTVVAGTLATLLLALTSWVRSKVGAERYSQIKDDVLDAIQAAEKLWKNGDLADDERYAWVLARLQERFPNLKETQIQVFIESAIWGLKQGAWLMNQLDGEEPVRNG